MAAVHLGHTPWAQKEEEGETSAPIYVYTTCTGPTPHSRTGVVLRCVS